MADSNVAVDNSELHANKGRSTLARNSVLISGAGASSNTALAGLRIHRPSVSHSFTRSMERRFIRYENTYRMEPDDDHKLDLVRVRRIATSVIETAISSYKYDGYQATQFAVALAEMLRNQMKQLPFQRYKIVTQVCIGQKKGQDLRVASRCVWDDKHDRHITITKEAADAYVTVTLFFVYTD